MEPNFLCLSSHEVGASIQAIEAVGRSDKPIAEVGNVKLETGSLHQLEDDLALCLTLTGEHEVKSFILPQENRRWTYGFYREPWAVEALRFLYHDGMQLSAFHRDWISGLLFGYRPRTIQRFLETSAAFCEPRPTLPLSDDVDRVETSLRD